MSTLILPAINLAILLTVLYKFTKKPVLDHVANRHAYVRDEARRVAEMLRSAREKYEEFSSKLKASEDEIAAIREQAKQDAQSMKMRIVTDAKKLADTIVSDAQTSAQALFSDLKAQLRMELGMRILDRSEQLVREKLTTDDRVRIRRDFSRQVGLQQ